MQAAIKLTPLRERTLGGYTERTIKLNGVMRFLEKVEDWCSILSVLPSAVTRLDSGEHPKLASMDDEALSTLAHSISKSIEYVNMPYSGLSDRQRDIIKEARLAPSTTISSASRLTVL